MGIPDLCWLVLELLIEKQKSCYLFEAASLLQFKNPNNTFLDNFRFQTFQLKYIQYLCNNISQRVVPPFRSNQIKSITHYWNVLCQTGVPNVQKVAHVYEKLTWCPWLGNIITWDHIRSEITLWLQKWNPNVATFCSPLIILSCWFNSVEGGQYCPLCP